MTVVVTVVVFVAMLPTCALALPFDRRRNVAHAFATVWARALLRMNPFNRIVVEGAEHLRAAGEGVVLAANHQSMADIIALYFLGHPFKWISKREIFWVPVIGQAMWLAGYVALKRGDRESARRSMAESREWLARGVSIMIFPEGTRSLDGRLRTFKDGAFRLASDSRRPIVPIAVDGPARLLKKGSWLFAPSTRIHVRIGKPIWPGDGPRDQERMKSLTRHWILHALSEIQGVPPASIDAAETAPRGREYGSETRVSSPTEQTT